HPDLGVDQNVWRISQNGLPPFLDREWSLNKALATLNRNLCLGVGHRPGVIAEQTKPLAVELGHPSLEWNLPNGMPPEEAAHNADTDRVIGCGRFWHWRAWIALRNEPASQ